MKSIRALVMRSFGLQPQEPIALNRSGKCDQITDRRTTPRAGMSCQWLDKEIEQQVLINK